MKVTKPSEYRKKQRKLLDLPSGAVFEIRKLSPIVYAEVLEKIGVTPDQADTVEAEKVVRKRILDIMKNVIPRTVVRPKIAVRPDPADEDILDFEDLELADVTALLDAIYEFSGLTTEAQEEREEFREEPVGELDKKASPTTQASH